jgi:hypothetical protein
VSEAAIAAHVRAWVFRAVDSDRTYIEFIEWKSLVGHSQSVPDRVAALLDGLEQHGPGKTRQWQET